MVTGSNPAIFCFRRRRTTSFEWGLLSFIIHFNYAYFISNLFMLAHASSIYITGTCISMNYENYLISFLLFKQSRYMKYSIDTTQDTRSGHSQFLGLPGCSSPLLYPWATPYRGTELAIWGLVLQTRECASRNSLVTGRPAIAGNRTQVCCMGGENITITPPNHLMLVTTKFEISMPISWDKSVALEPQLLPIECAKF